MKRRLAVLLVLIIFVLSGCTVVSTGKESMPVDTLKSLGIVYTAGEYTLKDVACYGFVTSGQTAIHIFVPVAKQFVDSQKVSVAAIENAWLRMNGKYIVGKQADLTQYISSAAIKNDGAILNILLENPDKWLGSDNKVITNNTSFTGMIDITFTVSDP